MKKILLLALMAVSTQSFAQDVEAGKAVYNQCRACHQIGEGAKNVVGPHLNGLFGRKAGAVEDYKYSDANKASGIEWTEESFTKYIQDPKAMIPGTKMVYAGLKDEARIKNLIAYLKANSK